jgi:hypothetical protein
MDKPNSYRTIHILGAILFMSIPWLIPASSPVMQWREFFMFLFTLIFFYLHSYQLVTRYYFQQKITDYIGVLLLSFLIIAFFPGILIVLIRFNTGLDKTDPDGLYSIKMLLFTDIKLAIFLFLAAIFASVAYRINDHLSKLHQEKVNAELSYLKAQINPHFLFNILNSIYSLAIVKSNLTATAIVKLSGMMRYVISETAEKFVPLEKEMSYINSYIDLQTIRLGETAIVNYAFNGETKNKVIAPMLLIPFIENAFKHGVNPEETSQIDIQLSVSDTHLYLHVFNLKVPHRISKADYSGLGLENGKHQLAYLYPGKHQLKIDDNNFSFTVNLNIELI